MSWGESQRIGSLGAILGSLGAILGSLGLGMPDLGDSELPNKVLAIVIVSRIKNLRIESRRDAVLALLLL